MDQEIENKIDKKMSFNQIELTEEELFQNKNVQRKEIGEPLALNKNSKSKNCMQEMKLKFKEKTFQKSNLEDTKINLVLVKMKTIVKKLVKIHYKFTLEKCRKAFQKLYKKGQFEFNKKLKLSGKLSIIKSKINNFEYIYARKWKMTLLAFLHKWDMNSKQIKNIIFYQQIYESNFNSYEFEKVKFTNLESEKITLKKINQNTITNLDNSLSLKKNQIENFEKNRQQLSNQILSLVKEVIFRRYTNMMKIKANWNANSTKKQTFS